MAALSGYVREAKRQAELLEAADVYDAACLSLNPPGFGPRARRHWTRQDRRRLEYDAACEEWDGKGAPPVPTGRVTTRVERILDRLPDIRGCHQRGLAEAQKQGTYAVLAPLLVAATKAHEKLLAHYRGDIDVTDWPQIERWHAAALAALEMHVQAAPQVALPNEARDKWLYKQAVQGTAWKGIVHALARRTDWEPIGTIPGLRLAAARYQKAHPNLPPIPRRQSGRKATRRN